MTPILVFLFTQATAWSATADGNLLSLQPEGWTSEKIIFEKNESLTFFYEGRAISTKKVAPAVFANARSEALEFVNKGKKLFVNCPVVLVAVRALGQAPERVCLNSDSTEKFAKYWRELTSRWDKK